MGMSSRRDLVFGYGHDCHCGRRVAPCGRGEAKSVIRARVIEKNINTVDRDFDAQKALDELRRRQRSLKDRNRKR
jgi:hypothetical protein